LEAKSIDKSTYRLVPENMKELKPIREYKTGVNYIQTPENWLNALTGMTW